MDASSYTTRRGTVIAADLGQVNDWTALSVLQLSALVNEDAAGEVAEIPRYDLVYQYRPPRGTPYDRQVEIIKALMRDVAPNGPPPGLVVDATGVGRPVIDMMRAKGLRPVAVSITGGLGVTSSGAMDFAVPKRVLVSALTIAFQTGKLRLAADLPTLEVLRTELSNFKAKLTTAGNEQFEAWRESIHDDLVLSLALAVWLADRGDRGAKFFDLHHMAR